MPHRAAFFDFDNTLLAGDSAKMGIRFLWEQGQVPLSYILRVMLLNQFFKRDLYPAERMARSLITYYRGRQLADFEAGATEYYHAHLKPLLAPALLERVEEHRRRGDKLVILSASVRYLLTPVVEDLGFDHLLCTDLEENGQGFLTGRAKGSICIGEGKRRAAERLAIEQELDLSQSTAYGDHHSDEPMLAMVGHPIAVEPTPRLRMIAEARGWSIMSHVE